MCSVLLQGGQRRLLIMLTAITDNAKTSALIPHLMTNRRPSGELRRYPIAAGCHCRTAPRVLAWSFIPGLHGLCMAAAVAGVECAMVPRVSLWRIVLCGVFPATRTPYNRRFLRTRACRLDCSAAGVFLVKYCQLVVARSTGSARTWRYAMSAISPSPLILQYPRRKDRIRAPERGFFKGPYGV